MHISSNRSRTLGASALALAAGVTVGLGATSAMGATWTGAGDGTSWSDTGNWSSGLLPTASDPAYFNASGGTHTTINVDSSTAIANGIQVSAGKSYTIGGNAITIPQKASISTSGTSSSLVFNSDVILRDATVGANRSGFATNGGSSLTINGDVLTASTAGSYDFQLAGGVVINGSVGTSLPGTSLRMYSNSHGVGTIATLNGVNTASIGMDVTWGTFVLNHAGAITNAAISTPSGRGGNATLAVKNALTGTGSISLGSSTAQKAWTNTLIQADQDYTGTTSITGQATWVGGPAITASLRVNNGHASTGSATGSGAVTVTGGLLAGDGRIVNAATTGVKLTNNGAVQGYLSPGASDGQVGTLAFALSGTNGLDISGAVFNTGTHALLFDLDTPSHSDLVTLAGKLILGSGKLEFDDFAFNPLAGFGNGTYTLFQTDTANSYALGTNLSGVIDGRTATLSFANSNKDIVLTVVPEPASLSVLALGAFGLLARRRRMA